MTTKNPTESAIERVATVLPVDGPGRRFSSQRSVRLGDVDPSNQLRLDALARYSQDIANDDALDADLPGALNYVVRKTLVEITTGAQFRETVELTTFCNGFGSRWAGRQTHVVGSGGASIALSTIWVHVDPDSGRPQRLDDHFTAAYGESACGQKADARLHHRALADPEPENSIEFSFRHVDLDLLGHVNNAVYWSAVEQLLAHLGIARTGLRIELEYKAPTPPERTARIVWERSGGHTTMWLRDAESGDVYATAEAGPLAP